MNPSAVQVERVRYLCSPTTLRLLERALARSINQAPIAVEPLPVADLGPVQVVRSPRG
jgi:hypothetical protein